MLEVLEDRLVPSGVFPNNTNPPALPPPTGQVINVSTVSQLQSAVGNLQSGQTISIAPGTYHLTGTLYVPQNLTNIAIRGADGKASDVVIQGDAVLDPTAPYNGSAIWGAGSGIAGTMPFGIWLGNVQGVTIGDITLEDFVDDAIILNAGVQSPLIHDVVMLDTGEQLLKSNPDSNGGGVNNGIVEYCTIGYTVAAPNNYTNGVDIHTTQNWIIRDNLFENIYTTNAKTTVGPGTLTGPAVLVWNVSSGALTEANTFINCQRDIAYGLDSSKSNDNTGGIIRNNFITETRSIGGDVAIGLQNSANTQVLNNTLWLNNDYSNAIEYRFAATTGVQILNNLTNKAIASRDSATGTLSGNLTNAQSSWFVNTATGDLHLTASATAAIGQVSPLSNVPDDYNGDSRPTSGKIDIGADEYTTANLTAQVTAPSAGALVRGSVTVTATATDGVAITGVQLNVDGSPVGSPDTTSPYAFTWNTTAFTSGTHQLTVTATDVSGNSVTSSPVSVTVDNVAPTVAVSAPAAGSVVAGTVTLTANASDNVAVAAVQFYVDNSAVGAADTTSPYTSSWDTTKLSDGSHVLTAKATDTAGNVTMSAPVTVTVDNTAPAVSVSGPAAGSVVAGTVTLTANASDNVAVAAVQFYVDNSAVGSADTTSPYTSGWDTTKLSDGSHVLTAKATDTAGNVTTSAPVTVTVDNTAPMVSVSGPAAGSAVSGTVNLTASASDNVAVAAVQFYVDNSPVGAADTTSPYTLGWDTTNLSDGSHVLTAKATDTAGNVTMSALVTVIVDNTVPAVSVSGPDSDSTVSGTVNLSASASDNVAVAAVQFYVDNSAVGAADTTSPYTSGWDTTKISDGTHVLTAKATDTAGNVTMSAPVAVTVDNTAPAVSVSGPPAGSTVSGTVNLTADASDNIGVTAVQYLVDDSPVGSPETTAPYTYAWNTTAVADGTHRITATASDAAGNVTTSAAVTITVSNPNPVVTIIGGPDSGHTPEGTPISLGTSISGTVAGDTFTYSWQVLQENADYATGTGATWQFAPDDDGTYQVSVVATDQNGVTAQSTRTFVADQVAPHATLTPPRGGDAGVPAAFTASATDPSSVDTQAGFTYAWDFGDGNTATGASVQHSFSKPGTYRIALTATDEDGMVGSASAVVTVVRLPTAVFIAPRFVYEGTTTAHLTFASPSGGSGAYAYSYDFNNDGTFEVTGTNARTVTIPEAFLDDGPATCVVHGRITDSRGGFTDYTAAIVVKNVVPHAVMQLPAGVDAGIAAAFAASARDASTADTNAGFTYTWNFGDGSGVIAGANPSHIYARAGTYAVTLTATDKDGTVGITHVVLVVHRLPTATLTLPVTVVEGTATARMTINVAGGSRAYAYSFDFNNDGNFEIAGSTSASAFIPEAYLDDGPGTLVVHGHVTDKAGAQVDVTGTIKITNAAPTAKITLPTGVTAGTAATFTVTVTDRSTADTNAGFTYTWDFGDGSSPETGASPSHTYAKAGRYHVTVTVTDKDGGVVRAVATLVVTV
jgi:PKD repeat protein